MPMPANLVFIRHAESEGNIAAHHSKKGDDRFFTEEFRNRHSSSWRLSELGRKQAVEAGKWINDNLGLSFHRHYVSEYVRAKETAGLLGLPNAYWFSEFYLRERDWGDLDVMPVSEREKRYSEAMRRRDVDTFYWPPPNGQSLADLCHRIDRVIDTLHRECSGKNVVIVCHGEVMWAFRVRLERMSPRRFLELDGSRSPHDRIHNCQILHYTRASDLGDYQQSACHPYLTYMRSICPWDTNLSSNDWQKIDRPRYTNEELLAQVERVKPSIL